MPSLAMQTIRVGDLDEPVQQNGSHLGLDAQMALQVEVVVRVFILFGAHTLPQVGAVRPAQIEHGR